MSSCITYIKKEPLIGQEATAPAALLPTGIKRPLEEGNRGHAHYYKPRRKRQRLALPKNALEQLNDLRQGLQYTLLRQSGPVHAPLFVMQVEVDGRFFQGAGLTKKKAKLSAAEQALQSLLQVCSTAQAPRRLSVPTDFTSDLSDIPSILSKASELSGPNDNLSDPGLQTPPISSSPKNSVMLLNEMRPGLMYLVSKIREGHTQKFVVSLTVGAQTFQGSGRNKRLAKARAAQAALRALFNLQPEREPSREPVPREGPQLHLPQVLADSVSRLILQKFSQLSYNCKCPHAKRKALAGVVMTTDEGVEQARVICISTGTQCIDGEHLSEDGLTVNDCHAEVVARRCLVRFLYSQLELFLSEDEEHHQQSIFRRGERGRGFRLKDKVQFHLYVSASPCGDACIFSPHDTGVEGPGDEPLSRRTRGVLRTKVQTGEGTVPVPWKEPLQTWDALRRGDRLLTMSCSDKMASIIVGSLYHAAHMSRAMYGRISPLEGLPPGFCLNRPLLSGISNPEARQPARAPPFSENWTAGDDDVEVIDSTTGKDELGGPSRLCKRAFYCRWMQLHSRRFLRSPDWFGSFIRRVRNGAESPTEPFPPAFPRFSFRKAVLFQGTDGMLQEQQAEWEPLNRLLQQRGFRPVLFADPVENKNPAELGLLDRKSAAALRRTLETLLADSDRRQALLQELVGSNNRLREEVQEQMSGAAQHSQRASELQALLDQVKVKVQDLEDRCICRAAQTHSRTLQLQRHSAEAIRRCEQLQQKLRRKEEEAAKLRWKLRFAVEQEERRLARRNRSFQEICGKTSRLQTAADQRVLDVIDFYEAERRRLMEELRSARGGAEASELQDGGERTAAGAPSSFKTDLKVFPQEERRTQLEAELDSRPTREQPKGRRRRHLEGLQPGAARLTAVGGAKTKGVEEPPREVWLCTQYRTLLSDIRAAIGSPAPSKEAESELADFRALLPVLEDWAGQRRLLKDLRDLLVDLSGGPRDDSAAAVKVEDLIVLVEDMLENASKDPEQKLRSSAPYTLSAIVSHFQKLFDVPSLRGVYPRMNEVYTRLAEMTNAMRNLKDALDLDGRASPAEVVNHVSALASAQQSGLRDLLEEADIDSVILKVKQHDEFLPAFHRLVTDILQTLGVTHLEEILPALKSLQRSAA